jgi:hypothetical protein
MGIDNLLLLIGMGASAIGFLATAAAYIHLAPWYLTPIGRWFVILHLLLGGMLTLLTINKAFNGDITRTVWAFLALALATISWGTFVTVIRTQGAANQPATDTPEQVPENEQ